MATDGIKLGANKPPRRGVGIYVGRMVDVEFAYLSSGPCTAQQYLAQLKHEDHDGFCALWGLIECVGDCGEIQNALLFRRVPANHTVAVFELRSNRDVLAGYYAADPTFVLVHGFRLEHTRWQSHDLEQLDSQLQEDLLHRGVKP